MSYKLVIGHDKLVSKWVGNELGVSQWLCDIAAIGVIRDETPVAGVVYYAYRWPVVEMACASIDKRWLSRKFLDVFFRYPFVTLDCKRLVSLVDEDNDKAHAFNDKLGFKREAVLKDAHPNGDAIMYGMLRSECRWINGIERLKNNDGAGARSPGNGAGSITGEFRSHIRQRFSQPL